VTTLIKACQDGVNELVAMKEQEETIDGPEAHCEYIRDHILPKMVEIRSAVDELEGLVADSLWPLPTYQEMLFIR
jgi:glutamine synthetase